MTKVTPFNVRSLLFFVLFGLISVTSGFTTSSRLVASSSSSKEVAKPHQQLYQTSLEDEDVVTQNNERSSGLLVLASVPLAWGTYSPVVKYVYEVDPQIPGIVFSAAYYIVATILLNGLASREQDSSSDTGEDDEFPYMGGLELGSYLFIANAMQVKGLETVPADRAGFLVQLTTIMVPLMQAASNRVGVPLQTWIACILAFAGVIIMGLDGTTEALTSTTTLDVSSISLSQGDLLIVAAAVLYSLHVVRLGQYATQTTALKLAASKATTEAFLSVVVVSCLFFLGNSGDVPNFFTALSSGLDSGSVTLTTLTPAICAVFWTGFVTCAYTIFAQSYGQARVGPTEANLLYTIQPLFTAVFGYLLLGETLGPAGVVGAVLIASAVYTVSSNQEDDAGVIIGDDGIGENEIDERSVNKTLQPVDEKILESTKR